MIHILNHNTSYKHSKFSARPAAVLLNTPGPAEQDLVAKGLKLKHKSRNLFEYQSKELLCWRYDLTFYSLYSFFFGILKALHVCWSFAKNNKTIVFISTDSPSDTGVSAVTDMLTQKYTREFLPRVWVPTLIGTPARTKIIPAAITTKSNNTSKRKRLSRKAQKLIRFVNTCANNPRKKTNLNHGYNVLYDKNQIINSFISKYNSTSRTANTDRLNNALTELKSLIHISGALEQTAVSESAPQNQSLAHVSYHKSDGLLYKAASRRLWASFSRTKAPFFSNTKSSFRELFSHLSDHSFQPLNPLQHTRFKMGFALDLNKRCLLKPIQVQQPVINPEDKKCPRVAKRYHVNSLDSVFSFSVVYTQPPFDKPFSKPFEKHAKQPQKYGLQDNKDIKTSQKEKSLLQLSKALVYDRVPLLHGITTYKKKLPAYAFNAYYRGFLNSIMKRKNKKQSQNRRSMKSVMCKQRQFYAGFIPYKRSRPESGLITSRIMSKHVRKQHPLERLDFYGTIMNDQVYQETKRFANSPYVQHADLVFFVNPDKNPGLASQIKKLGIPSIGIVSGLKSSTYRKQPTHSNLHDSVTYPITGNSDNVAFVMMVVRIFVQLIQKAEF